MGRKPQHTLPGSISVRALDSKAMEAPPTMYQPRPIDTAAVSRLPDEQFQKTRGLETSRNEANASDSYDAFISHFSLDAALARIVYDYLTLNGKRVFLSEVSLQALGKADYMKAIDTALEQSKHLVLIGSSVANITSSWVEAEWRVFISEMRSGRKIGNFITIVPCALEPSSLPIALRYYEVIPMSKGYRARILKYIN
jgi:hypothetical protein